MHVIVWVYEVRPGYEDAFEKHYGPEGSWARLFGLAAGYRGTRLLRDTAAPGRYATIDSWDSAAAFDEFKAQHAGQYEALDAICDGLTVSETRIGAADLPDAAGAPTFS